MERVEHNASSGMIRLVGNRDGLLQLIDIPEKSQEFHRRHHAHFLAQFKEFTIVCCCMADIQVLAIRYRRSDNASSADGRRLRHPSSTLNKGSLLGLAFTL